MRNYTAVRQTACRHCGFDIEGFAPYRKGEWQDRGSETHCAYYDADGNRDDESPKRKAHAPYRDQYGRMNG